MSHGITLKYSKIGIFYELCFYCFRMTSKAKESGRKSISPWMTCVTCQSILTQKDVTVHGTNCPPNFKTWNHDFIYSGILYSTMETHNPLGIYAFTLNTFCIFFFI